MATLLSLDLSTLDACPNESKLEDIAGRLTQHCYSATVKECVALRKDHTRSGDLWETESPEPFTAQEFSIKIASSVASSSIPVNGHVIYGAHNVLLTDAEYGDYPRDLALFSLDAG